MVKAGGLCCTVRSALNIVKKTTGCVGSLAGIGSRERRDVRSIGYSISVWLILYRMVMYSNYVIKQLNLTFVSIDAIRLIRAMLLTSSDTGHYFTQTNISDPIV
jgi:hypothetical protein